MTRKRLVWSLSILALGTALAAFGVGSLQADDFEPRADWQPGQEVAVPIHLQDGEEYTTPLPKLIRAGGQIFNAVWTPQEGGGRPLTDGTGKPLVDPSRPLVFPDGHNRLSGPDANSCAGCHNTPRSGGGGDIVANVFVLGNRFDFMTFDPTDAIPGRGSVDERGDTVNAQSFANSRATLGMFGSGYIEMAAREITFDLKAQANALAPGQSTHLTSKGISFGTLARGADGSWDTSGVEGLSPGSLASAGPAAPPSLIVKPFHQVGAVVSLREFSNNAFNQHHGIQAEERFGVGQDPDGDGFVNEMTRADVTAVSIWQATLSVPGRKIPRWRPLEEAVLTGEEAFARVGCAECHVPAVPLSKWGEYYYEPNPFNPPGNATPADMELLKVNLNSGVLPGPRLKDDSQGITWVPAFTDFKIHDITTGPDDPNCEVLNQQAAPGSDAFFAGNCRFLTKKLWGIGNEPPYYHHGQYATIREAIEAHAGEAQASADAYHALSVYEQGSIIELLKTLQVLPAGTKSLVVDENDNPRPWPPAWAK